jgi:hypothetical protein
MWLYNIVTRLWGWAMGNVIHVIRVIGVIRIRILSVIHLCVKAHNE